MIKHVLQVGSAAALALGLVAGQAQAAGLCKLTGSYSDNYGSTTSIKGLHGTISNGVLCSTAYTFKISNETKTGFIVTGHNMTKSCGKFTANLTFMGSCSVFGGTITVDKQPYSDTFTKIAGSTHRQPPAASDLTNGLR